MSKDIKKLLSLLLATLIIISLMVPATAAQKISNPQIRGGIDGIDPDPAIGLHNSYGWCGEVFEQTDADYLWIGSNRDLGSNVYTGLESVLELMSFSLPAPSSDQAAKIYRQKLSDPDAPWELMYENAAISGYRKMIVFNGDLYVLAGQTNRDEANYAFILRFPMSFKKGDVPEIVFWENLRGLANDYFRSATIYDGKLYIGTFDSKIYMTDGNNLQNLIPNISQKSTGWSFEVLLDDYGIKTGAAIWDMVTFNDSIYVFYEYELSATAFSVAKMTQDGGGGYTVEQVVGDDGTAKYPSGMGAGRYGSASPFVSTSFDKDYVYVSTFSGGLIYLVGLANGLIEETMNNLYSPMAIYRFDENDHWEVVAGDTTGAYIAVDNTGAPVPHISDQRSGFFLQDNKYDNVSANMYTWWMAEYNGKLYASTWDVGVFRDEYFMMTLIYLSRITNGAIREAMSGIETLLKPLIGIYEAFMYGNVNYFAYKTEMAEYLAAMDEYINETGKIDKDTFIESFSEIINKYFSPQDAADIIRIFDALVDEIDANGLDGPFNALSYLLMFNDTAYYFLDSSNPPGFDLYVSEDGVNFEPITVDGFGDPYNYGGRIIIPSEHGLFVATANPFNGLQVWRVDPIGNELFINGPREAFLSADDVIVVTALVYNAGEGDILSLKHNGNIVEATLVKRGATRALTDISWDNEIIATPETDWKSYAVTEKQTEYTADIYDVVITPIASGQQSLILEFEIGGLAAVKEVALTVDMGHVSGGVDKLLLGERLALASGLTESDYTESFWPQFIDAVDKAQTVYDNASATQEQVNSALIDLVAAMSRLLPNTLFVDKTELAIKIEQAQSLWQADYGPVLWAVFVRARDAAITVYNNPDAQQAGVDSAVRALSSAMDALIPVAPAADKTNLGILINSAKILAGEDYTAESWALFSSELDGAELIYDNPNATQAQVDAALAGLNLAINALVNIPPTAPADKTALEAVLNIALTRVETDYTTASWILFEQSRESAQAVYVNETATQEQVDDAAGLLFAAMEALVAALPDKSAAPEVTLPVYAGDKYIGGVGTPGAAIYVAWPGGAVEGAAVGNDGNWMANVPQTIDLHEGNIIQVIQYETGKNPSEPVVISVTGVVVPSPDPIVTPKPSPSPIITPPPTPTPDAPAQTPSAQPSPIATPSAESTPTPSPQPSSQRQTQGSGGQGSAAGGAQPATPATPASPAPINLENEPLPMQAPSSMETPQPSLTPSPMTLVHERYIFGYPGDMFYPDEAITRAETAVILYRLLMSDGGDPPGNAESFADISAGDWFFQAVSYLAGAGVIHGYPDGTFMPDEPITRAEFAAMIAGLYNCKPSDDNSFPDIEGHWAKDYIDSVAAQGWVNGYPDGSFRPENHITRAEVVAVINRTLVRMIENSDIPDWAQSFNDVPPSHWAYADIIEASISHSSERKDNGYELWLDLPINN